MHRAHKTFREGTLCCAWPIKKGNLDIWGFLARLMKTKTPSIFLTDFDWLSCWRAFQADDCSLCVYLLPCWSVGVAISNGSFRITSSSIRGIWPLKGRFDLAAVNWTSNSKSSLSYWWLPLPLSHHSYPQTLHGLFFPGLVVWHILFEGSASPLDPKTQQTLSETGAGTICWNFLPLAE